MRLKALICGPRNWSKPIPVDVVVGGLASVYGTENVTVVQGKAPGADSMARSAAHRHGVPFEDFPADWAGNGKAAGPIRNQQMLDEGEPDVAFAFAEMKWSEDLVPTRGTADMVRRAHEAGIPVYLVVRVV